MNITVLGSGMVGQIVAGKLLDLGHDVIMGTRDPEATLQRTDPNYVTGKSFAQWYADYPQVELMPYGTSAQQADLLINATKGEGSIPALMAVGKSNLAGKTLLDISNPLDFSQGMPPFLSICNTDSLAEQIQAAFPELKVVKGLNTMNAMLMVDPAQLPGDHNTFLSGNDAEAKVQVSALLQSLGWKRDNIIDLGDITTARGSEMLLPIWLRLWGALGHANFNFHIVSQTPG